MSLRWLPDFCQMTPGISGGCILLYRYVGGERVNEARFYEATQQTCAGHTGVSGAALAVVLTDETRRRQGALGIARAIDFSLLNDKMSAVYSGLGESRVLRLSFLVNIVDPVKQRIKDVCDIQFGPTKVMVL